MITKKNKNIKICLISNIKINLIKKMSINLLPNPIIKYIGAFLVDDDYSYAQFSIVNKKFFQLLFPLPHIYGLIKRNFPNERIYQDYHTLINKKNANNGDSLFHTLFRYKKHISIDLLKFLFEKKCDINAENLLHLACKKEDLSIEIIKFMIDCKSDVQIKNHDSDLPLHILCSGQNKKISLDKIKLLILNKSDINSKNIELNTALHLVCDNKNISFDLIQFLCDKKCNPRSRNKNGDTPFDIALKNGNSTNEILQYFGKFLQKKI
jgi:hypothetical protein